MVDGYTDYRRLSGPLLGIEGDMVSIEDRKVGAVSVPFSAINYAQLVLTDRLIAATKPLDMSGADEFEETLPEDETSEEKVED